VCALRGEKRSLISFRNYLLEGKTDLQPKIWEAARATSAATLFFDPITIGRFNQTFVDGAGGHNNPVEAIYGEAVARWNAKAGDFSSMSNHDPSTPLLVFMAPLDVSGESSNAEDIALPTVVPKRGVITDISPQ